MIFWLAIEINYTARVLLLKDMSFQSNFLFQWWDFFAIRLYILVHVWSKTSKTLDIHKFSALKRIDQ